MTRAVRLNLPPRSVIGGGIVALLLALLTGACEVWTSPGIVTPVARSESPRNAHVRRRVAALGDGVVKRGSSAIELIHAGEIAPSAARVRQSPSAIQALRGLRGGGLSAVLTKPLCASCGSALGATAAAAERRIDWRRLLRTRLHYRGTRAEPADARA